MITDASTRQQRRGGARPPRASRPATLGLIKVGMKGEPTTSERGKTYRQPVKLNHFLICRNERPKDSKDENFRVDQELMLLHDPTHAEEGRRAPQPRRIPILLLSDEPTENCYYRWAYYDSTRCRCYNDTTPGSGIARWIDQESGEECDRPCSAECQYRAAGQCKDHLVLQFLLQKAPGVGGVWKFRSTSQASADALFEAMDQIKQVTGGPLAGVPLELVCQWRTVQRENGMTVGVPLVTLVFPGTPIDLIQAAERYMKALACGRSGISEAAQGIVGTLPDPADLGDEERHQSPEQQEEIAAEFHPPAPDPDEEPEQPRSDHWWDQLTADERNLVYERGRQIGWTEARVGLEARRFGSPEALADHMAGQRAAGAEEPAAVSDEQYARLLAMQGALTTAGGLMVEPVPDRAALSPEEAARLDAEFNRLGKGLPAKACDAVKAEYQRLRAEMQQAEAEIGGEA